MPEAIRLLQDIRIAGPTEFPDSGIPQDTRLLFKVLANAEGVDLSVLLHPDLPTSNMAGFIAESPTGAASMLLNGYGISYGGLHEKRGLSGKIARMRERYIRRRRPLPIAEVDPLLADSVWRRYLARSLPPADRELLDHTGIFVSEVAEHDLISRSKFRRPLLQTQNFDFMLFSDLRRARLAPNTTKLLRYYDALPLTAAEMFPAGVTRMHYTLLRASLEDSVFVCISETVRKALTALFPVTESRSAVIPCTLDAPVPPSELSPAEIVASYVLTTDVGGERIPAEAPPDFKHGDDYILMVSTVEPRKNHFGALEAFARLVERLKTPLKFIIVGKPGMGFPEVRRAMEPMLAKGQVIHLSGVPRPELSRLYADARALVFPSFDEGFGYTPLEAMAYGTPAVVSDITTHRWVLEDAALFAPATDPSATADQLERLLTGDGAEALRAELRRKGPRVLDRYSVETTARQWSELLHKLKAGASAGKPAPSLD